MIFPTTKPTTEPKNAPMLRSFRASPFASAITSCTSTLPLPSTSSFSMTRAAICFPVIASYLLFRSAVAPPGLGGEVRRREDFQRAIVEREAFFEPLGVTDGARFPSDVDCVAQPVEVAGGD